jgi:hypothetical protein
MKIKLFIGQNETTEQLMLRSFALFCVVLLMLFIAILNAFDENPLFLISLAALTLPMSYRLGRLLFPQSNYLQILSDIRANKSTSDSPKTQQRN